MKPICKFLLDLRDELQTLKIPSKKNWGVFRGIFWGGMHKSKVAQNPKVCRKPIGFFDLSILCALKVHFLIFTIFKDIKSQFSKTNLGYLDTLFDLCWNQNLLLDAWLTNRKAQRNTY